MELIFLQDFIPQENKEPVEIMATIAYRILLTIPVTFASVERSFSKLKLLNTYLRSIMTQERLNALALIALESGMPEKIDYEYIIEDFISKNAKRISLFK